jgi:3-oxoadipate enol-lactonase
VPFDGLRRDCLTVAQPADLSPTPPTVETVDIPERGRLLVWESAGPAGAQAVVLLHGVTMTAELGWSLIIGDLGRSYRVIAPDLRGHGDGIPCRSGAGFSLEDCADDVAALVDVLGLERVIVVGYSMGGMVAQLMWRRHPDKVAALVLCATARNVRGSAYEQLVSWALPGIASTMQLTPVAHVLSAQLLGSSFLGYIDDPQTRHWARRQLHRTSLSTALSAMRAVSDFTSHEWIGQVDVPTAVVITTEDRLVPVSRQRRLAAAIPGARVVELAADHGVCVRSPELLGKAVSTACDLVVPSR